MRGSYEPVPEVIPIGKRPNNQTFLRMPYNLLVWRYHCRVRLKVRLKARLARIAVFKNL
jgi:hypothetical protein